MNHNFCEIHKDEIAQFRCSRCGNNVCLRCSVSASSFCPKCRGTNILKVEKKLDQNEIRNILLTGFFSAIISILINTLTDNAAIITNKTLIVNALIFLGFGIAISSSIYFVRKTSVFDEIQAIPLFGLTIIKYLIVLSSIVGIPILYFLYLVYKFFKEK